MLLKLSRSIMTTNTGKKILPPYVPYSTFVNFIGGLRDAGVPSHIDKSIMPKMSGSGQSAMMAAIKSMHLIDDSSQPTNNLKKLIDSNEDNQSFVMADIVKQTYPLIFDNGFNIKTATSKLVEDKFRDAGASGSTLTKCISFFLAAAKAADLEVSPHVKAPKLQTQPRKKRTKPVKERPIQEESSIPSEVEQEVPDGMERITVPLRGMDDGIIYFPSVLDEQEAKKAVKMARFILNNFYGIDDD